MSRKPKRVEDIPDQPEIPVLETPKKEPKYWLGDAPDKCDVGGCPITTTFVDGKTNMGPWGFMCPTCHSRHGYGLGTGKGQVYTKQDDGRWLKTGG